MKRSILTLTALVGSYLPLVANAQGNTKFAEPLRDLLENIVIFINNVAIPFIISIGFLFFIWGMFQYFILGGADEEKKERGKSLMIWSIIAFVTIIIFFGVINLFTSSTGLQGESLKFIPQVPFPSA